MYLEFRNQLESLQLEVCNTPSTSYMPEARLLAQLIELNDWDPIKNSTLAQWAVKHPVQGLPVLHLGYHITDRNTLTVIAENRNATLGSTEPLVLFKLAGISCLTPGNASHLAPKLLKVLTDTLTLAEMRLVNYFMLCFTKNQGLASTLKQFHPSKALFRTQENLAKLAA